MATLHVFVDGDGQLSAVIPKPVAPEPGMNGPVFAGISPVGSADGIEGYEIEVDDELLASSVQQLDKTAENPLERQIKRQLSRRSGLTKIDYLRDN